ncbi:MAG: zinc dependent phospholipase C family protein [Desulfotalea sp.]
MPGAFAHQTMIHVAKKLPQSKEFSDEMHRAINSLLKYAELGSVSPDYPYLCLFDGETDEWADLMHYISTGEMILSGTRLLQTMKGGLDKRKCIAWLMGYTAHVVTDVSIHPVVKLKVGDYAENTTEHRICEMNQDAYIYETKLSLGPITDTEHLKEGICTCGQEDSIDPVIKTFWSNILKEIHPEKFASNPPDIDKWHRNFIKAVDGVADEDHWLPTLMMYPLKELGIIYKDKTEVDLEYIENLEVPGGQAMGYEEIFDKAAKNVADTWLEISKCLDTGNEITIVKNWDLDTGIDPVSQQITFWNNIQEDVA